MVISIKQEKMFAGVVLFAMAIARRPSLVTAAAAASSLGFATRRNPPAFAHPVPSAARGGQAIRRNPQSWEKSGDGDPSFARSSTRLDGAGGTSEETQFIAKTVESFKLADLYWLESCVMARCLRREEIGRGGYCTPPVSVDSGAVGRLAFHRPTASYLLTYTNDIHRQEDYESNNYANDFDGKYECDDAMQKDFNQDERTTQTMEIPLPFRPGCFQYVAQVIASGQTPHELINNIQNSYTVSTKSWILKYDTFEPLQNPVYPKKSFSSTMLLCAVSRALPGEPSLTSHGDITSYVIVETAARLYLAQKLPSCGAGTSNGDADFNPQLDSTRTIAKQFRTSWSQRPFQYSGAINLDAALAVVDMLGDAMEGRDASEKIRILDPACGSGTFLALALAAWGSNSDVEAVGVDSNPKCARGTVRNLSHLFSDAVTRPDDDGNSWTLSLDSNGTLSSAATIYCDDSSRLPTLVSQRFDCAVANLPWNRNTFEFNGTDDNAICTNSAILKATAAVLKPGSPMVVVSAGNHDERGGGHDNQPSATASFNAINSLENLGFRILGEATIPPKGFELPASWKRTGGSGSAAKKNAVSRSSDCIITAAVAPERMHNK